MYVLEKGWWMAIGRRSLCGGSIYQLLIEKSRNKAVAIERKLAIEVVAEVGYYVVGQLWIYLLTNNKSWITTIYS